jgi:hypothetical protein
MTLLKWVVLFVCAFCVAFVIIVTFSQAPFRQPVPAKIFTYQTPAVALYWYVIGAVCVGLALGLVVALYYGIVLNASLYKKNRRIRELEEKIGVLEGEQSGSAISPPPDTKLLSEDPV